MKKFINYWLLPALLSCIFCLESHAQIHVGARGGINFADLGPYNVIPFSHIVRPNFALLLNVPVSPVFSLQIEPGFSQRGGKFDESGEEILGSVLIKIEATGKISSNYIELPLLFQYRPKFGKFEGIVSIGPELRYRVGAARLNEISKLYQDGVLITDNSGETDLSAINNYKDFDYGLTGGGGIAYPMPNLKIFTEARYHLGLGKIYQNGVDIYNRGVSVHLGILVPIP